MKFNELAQLVEQELLLEANAGDIAEGFFAIGLCLMLAGYKPGSPIFKSEFERMQKKIDPLKTYKQTIYNNKWDGPQAKPDWLQVNLQLKLKSYKTCDVQFGGGKRGKGTKPGTKKTDRDRACFTGLDDPDYAGIKNQALTNLKSAASVQKIIAARDKFFANNKSEFIEILVVADGVAGEASAGELKGDVSALIYVGAASMRKAAAQPKGKELNIDLHLQDKESVIWSVKSGSRTASNRSPVAQMLALSKAFKVKMSPNWKKTDDTNLDKDERWDVLQEMWTEFVDTFMSFPDGKALDRRIYKFLKNEAFGTDAEAVLAVETDNVKEFTQERLIAIAADKGIMRVETIDQKPKTKGSRGSPNPKMLFLNVCPDDVPNINKDLVFSARIKAESKGSFKFMVEFGGTRTQVGMSDEKFEAEQEVRGKCKGKARTDKTDAEAYGKQRFTGKGKTGYGENKHLTKTPGSYTMLHEMIENLMGEE